MAEAKIDIPPASWQVTATTVECDFVDDYVTIVVNRDWTCKCSWWSRYKKVAEENPKHKFPKEIKEKLGKCQGLDCKHVTGYRDKLIAEETAAKK